MERIVVLGGSFNPPTMGHFLLLQSVVEAVGAEKGIFLPSSYEYVYKKMRAKGEENRVMPDEARLAMLCRMCESGAYGIEIEDFELHYPLMARTYDSLRYIGEKHQGAEIFFVIGSDKLRIIPKWYKKAEILRDFRMLVAARAEDNAEELIASDAFLSKYRDSFLIFEPPAGISEISSSLVRDLFREGRAEEAEKYLYPGTCQVFAEFCADAFRVIDDFHADGCEFLSNFYSSPVTFGGLTYRNAEAAFQAQKTQDGDMRRAFTDIDGGAAKSLGKKVRLRPDWEFVKVSLMLDIVRAKFRQSPELAEKLLATGSARLVEANGWNDTFWGVDRRSGKGENYLGRILMQVRRELKFS